MASLIEEYALLSDLSSSALVDRTGSIDWLTFPRFDSGACFAALLGDENNGRWQIAPAEQVQHVERRYRDSSLVLETTFHTASGTVAVIDCMVPVDGRHDLVRVVEGRSGIVGMKMHLTVRFDYGHIVPWVRRAPGGLIAVGGPEALRLATPVEVCGEDFATVADFQVREGEHMSFSLTWFPSDRPAPQPIDAVTAIAETELWWNNWAKGCTYDGDYHDEVMRSLIVLKGLTHHRTGGIIAAATTSLPEEIGGERNWDYRYCWLRDATFSLMALQTAGFTSEAMEWQAWLLRAVAGNPDQLQIMYGPGGERRLSEFEIPWLDGYENSKPVRIGNGAHDQYQLDVYGEVIDALYQGRIDGQPFNQDAWLLQIELIDYVADHWRDADDGIWEMRGPRRHFTHSKVMAWVALDRAIDTVEEYGCEGDIQLWRKVCDEVHADVLANGVDENGAFVQSYGSDRYDASLLMVPLVGFLPPDDPHVAATVEAIEKHLTRDGLVLRYDTEGGIDGLAGDEGVFLMCSFWLADNYALMGRLEEATALFERLVGLTNDVGLLSEEYDPAAERMLGNFPQAFSHVSLINSATYLSEARQARERAESFEGTKLRRRPHDKDRGGTDTAAGVAT